MSSDAEAPPTWIVAGADVVTYTRSRNSQWRYDHSSIRKIVKVATKSFSVTGGDRYSIDRQQRPGPGAFGSPYHCVPLDSDTARAVLAERARRQKQYAADVAVQAWQKDRSRESRLALIAALQAIED